MDSLGRASLADFGSALNKEATSSAGGGTLAFLAPESIEESLFTEKSDIYALGITCLEMAEKDPPNVNLPQEQLAMKIMLEDSPTLKSPKEWSIHFNDFISCCLVKNHKDRQVLSDIKQKNFLNFALPHHETMPSLLSQYNNQRKIDREVN